ncbi:hypothetical protein, partial [Lysobacter sp. Root983]|uniref:hypothetical protein n=1 Tax=Lysobacter sp. Root983 TaxID=1736613 RepID=UPI001F380903
MSIRKIPAKAQNSQGRVGHASPSLWLRSLGLARESNPHAQQAEAFDFREEPAQSKAKANPP